MRIETIMKHIQQNDVALAETPHEESYEFYIDIANSMEQIGKYQAKYYKRCEQIGISLKEAHDQLGEYLRSNLTVIRSDIEDTKQN